MLAMKPDIVNKALRQIGQNQFRTMPLQCFTECDQGWTNMIGNKLIFAQSQHNTLSRRYRFSKTLQLS